MQRVIYERMKEKWAAGPSGLVHDDSTTIGRCCRRRWGPWERARLVLVVVAAARYDPRP